jgi:hypothetical protein
MAPLPVMTLAQAQAVSPPAGESMTVTFDPSPSVGVAGYKIYYGNSINNLVSFVDIGNVTTATVQTGLQYPIHLAATAYDTNGNESVFSNFAGVLGPEAHDVIYAQTNSDLAMGAWNDAFLVLQATNSQPNFYRLRINRNIQHVTYP